MWADILPIYAAFQRGVAPAVDDLLGAGVPDERPARYPDMLAGLLADDRIWTRVDADERPRTDAARRRLVDLGPFVAELAATLEASAVPASLDHGDLHGNNLVPVADGSFRLFDWGDAVVAHPFATLTTTLGSIGYHAGVDPYGPVVGPVRDAYLSAWADIAPAPDLRTSCDPRDGPRPHRQGGRLGAGSGGPRARRDGRFPRRHGGVARGLRGPLGVSRFGSIAGLGAPAHHPDVGRLTKRLRNIDLVLSYCYTTHLTRRSGRGAAPGRGDRGYRSRATAQGVADPTSEVRGSSCAGSRTSNDPSWPGETGVRALAYAELGGRGFAPTHAQVPMPVERPGRGLRALNAGASTRASNAISSDLDGSASTQQKEE